MKKNPTVEFPIARAIREQIFKIPLLPQDQIVARFQELDSVLYPHALKLTEKFPRLRDYFQEVMFRIASGNTLGKNYYDKEDHEDEKGKKSSKKIFKNSEKRVLAKSFALFRLKNQPQRFCSVVKEAGFLRGVFEEAIELFLEITQGYTETLDAMRKAALAHSPDFIELERKVHFIENELGFYNSDELVFQVVETNSVWKQYSKLRDNLIAPYFRMVYTIAKSTSTSEAQTLDNFQNGIFGLVRAVKCYTPTRFAAFSVVAKTWIKQSILLNLKTEVNLIKLPVANWHLYQKLEKIRQKIETKMQRDATLEQISKASKIPLEKVQKIYENAKLVHVLSLNTPSQTEDEKSNQAKWNLESIQANDTHRERFEIQNEYELIEHVIHLFDEEEQIIFGLISGCSDLIPEPELPQELILKESLRQKAARRGLSVIFK
jgi:RNA polymerase sigma factor (sigma-70 family)